jgi:hypothetical protein
VAVVGRRQDPAPERLSRGDALSSLARLLLGLEPGLGWPDFAALGVSSHASFGVGPPYRGRFEDLSVVVLADQASDDDLFTGRALSGDAGHRLAQFLGAAGLTRSYLILRTLPVDTLDLTQARRNSLLDQPQVRALHRELLRRVCSQNPKVRVLLAIGPGAQRLAAQVVPVGVDAIPLAKAGTSGAAASWQAALDQLATRSYPRTSPTPRSSFPRVAASSRGSTCRTGRCAGWGPPATVPSVPPTSTSASRRPTTSRSSPRPGSPACRPPRSPPPRRPPRTSSELAF